MERQNLTFRKLSFLGLSFFLTVTAFFLFSPQVLAQNGVGLSVTDTTQVFSQRVGRTVWVYVYTVTVTNTGSDANNVSVTVTSTSGATTILDGSVTVGNVPAGSAVTSTDTFSFRHDRRTPFDPAALNFDISAETPPGAFNILGPSGVIVENTPTVSWEASPGADLYDLRITSDENCSTIVFASINLTVTSLAVSPLPNGNYFSCVNAKDSAGNITSASNNGLAFTVSPLGAFNILGPSGVIMDSSPTISWEASSGADRYDLRLGRNATCTNVILNRPNLTVSGRTEARATLGKGLAVSAFPLYVPV